MNHKNLWPIVLLLLTSCLDPANVALRQETQKLVIEGLMTNEANPFLRLSLTVPFGSVSTIEPLKGAYVEVRPTGAEAVVFRSAPDELGIYRPDNRAFGGKPGVAYSLYLKLPDGREYRSEPQTLPNPVPIDNLSATFVDGPQFGFQTFLDVKDPANTENYYRWAARGYHQRRSKGVPVGFGTAVCCDRCWTLKEETAVNVFSDALVNGSLIKARPVFFSPFYVLGKHLIEVQQYTLTRQAYQYWNRYRDQQQRTGSIFDPLPAPLLGNVVNINDPQDVALGFFEVSGIARKRIEPTANTQGQIAFNLSNDYYIPPGDCMTAFPFSVYISVNPPGW
jgi:hypothetical protein